MNTPRITVTNNAIGFEYDGSNLTLARRMVTGDVTIDALQYTRSTDHTVRYENVSGRAVWALLHDFLS